MMIFYYLVCLCWFRFRCFVVSLASFLFKQKKFYPLFFFVDCMSDFDKALTLVNTVTVTRHDPSYCECWIQREKTTDENRTNYWKIDHYFFSFAPIIYYLTKKKEEKFSFCFVFQWTWILMPWYPFVVLRYGKL